MKLNRLISSALIMGMCVITLSGCGNQYGSIALDCTSLAEGNSLASPDREVVVVIAPTDNFVPLHNALKAASGDLRPVLAVPNKKTNVSLIVADGAPRLISTQSLDLTNISESSQADAKVKRVMTSIDGVAKCLTNGSIDTVDQPNFLAAIQLAGSKLSTAGDGSMLLVVGNGIQTSGDLKLQQGLPKSEGETESLLNQLNSEGALDGSLLSGVGIRWFGLGEVAGENQEPLSNQSMRILASLWQGILRLEGAQIGDGDVEVGSLVNATLESDGVIQVEPIKSLASACTYVLPDDVLTFKDDLAEFKFPRKAKAVAQDIAISLAQDGCDFDLKVTGYVASGTTKEMFEKDPSRGEKLSEKRARSFRTLLIDAGVKNKIVPIGGGHKIPDWDANGNPDEDLQIQNRMVVVSPA